MKPWYYNYCFAEECLDEPPMYNSDMVLYFVYNYIDSMGQLPDNMLDTNIRTDYGKLRMLIRKDRGFEHDASVIQHLVETGTITAKLKDSFPSERITDPDNFVPTVERRCSAYPTRRCASRSTAISPTPTATTTSRWRSASTAC